MDAHALECLDFPRVRTLLAGYALTGLGRSLAESIEPVARPELVRRWLAQVVEYQRLSEQRGVPPFGGITDVRATVKRCAPPLKVTVEDVAGIGDALRGTHAVAGYFRNLPDGFPELQHLAGRIGDFDSLADRIRRVIDERGHVRDEASHKLQRIRRDIDQATSEIGRAVERLLRDPNIRRLLQYPNATFHNDRMVLPVRAEYRGRLQGIVHRTSDTGATMYVEPAEAVELNNQISDLRGEELEEINRLLWELAHEIHLNGKEILRTLDALAVIDLVAAKARFARDFELRCPEITDDATLKVREARHPLLLDVFRQRREAGLSDEQVVPIDYRIGDDFDLLVITGPNTGGKTVTLKTIGLLALMAQAGLPLPTAPGTTLGVFTDILIDIGDEQSMQQSLSTFSGHVTRLLDMMRHAGNRTLVLVDELGAGTDPDEGAAIGKAVLDEFLRLGARCAVTTHLGALKGYALTRPRAENASVEFDIETLRPTYHLKIGESGASCAIDVAQRLGMPRRLVTAARKNLSRTARHLQAALRGTASVKRKAERARADAETARLEASEAHTQATEARAVLEKQQQDFRAWVARVVHLQPGDAVRVRNFDRDGKVVRLRLDQQRAEVDVGSFAVEVPLGDVLPPEAPAPPPRPEPPRPAPVRPTQRSAPAARRADKSARPSKRRERGKPSPAAKQRPADPPLPPLSDEQAKQLAPGDAIYVKRFHREGRVVRVKAPKKLVVVSAGLLEVEVPYSGLALPRQRASGSQRKRPRAGDSAPPAQRSDDAGKPPHDSKPDNEQPS